ncbi:hypothetical protein CDD83_946 [Cordyceps sp. RAO-2017]|nr:hypothetical protein CDD83_946 [Cordyceps sp. RAO-2017]
MLSAQLPQPSVPVQSDGAARSQQLNETIFKLAQQADKPYGQRLAVNIIDETAAKEPNRAFVCAPRTSDPRDGWEEISYQQISNAINNAATDIVKRFGSAPKDSFPTVAYIGPNDVRYLIMMMGCIKAGYQVFFISPRNSTEGYMALFEATNCNIVYWAGGHEQLCRSWLPKRKMELVEAPSVKDWLRAEAKPVPYTKAFESAQYDPMVVLHTSGSTGLPKPIVVRQGPFALADAFRFLPPSQNGSKFSLLEWSERAKRIFLPMPMFHAGGVYVLLTEAIFFGHPIALGIPDRPLNADLVLQSLKNSGGDGALLPPSILEELSHSDEGVETLKKLQFVSFGGGALSKSAGDKLVERGVTLENSLASTEQFPYPRYFQKNSKLWNYFHFNMDAVSADWRPVDGDDDLRELVFVRRDTNGRRGQGIFYTFPDLTEWATKDMFRRHPQLPDHWVYQGRIDNIIVLSNGEKLNPVSIEGMVSGHPKVKGAVVVGHQRFQPALLIEPVSHPSSSEEREQLIEEIWPTIDGINKETMAHGRIGRSFIGFTNPDKPLPRSGKGAIQRMSALQLYKEEVDDIYNNAWSDESLGPVALDISSTEALTQSVLDLLHTKLGAPQLEADTDIFTVGIDSAQVIQLANLVKAGLNSVHPSEDNESIAPKDIYANPAPAQLAGYLMSVVDGSAKNNQGQQAEIEMAETLLAKYTADLPAPVRGKPEPSFDAQTVLLTGTTGSLGAYMLDILSAMPQVKKIVAMNRGSDGGKSRQPGVSGERGLSQDFSKVQFVGVDLSKQNLGLEQQTYNTLLQQADRIIHNAWPVNFNISVGSFEPHIAGVRRLVDFAAAAKKQVPIIFLSSVSTVGAWTKPENVPEAQFSDLSVPTMGYGRSKAASSLILDAAAAKSGVTTAVIRVGQIGGPAGEKGSWNKQEFFPGLVASAVHLGILPENLGPRQVVDWLTIEDTAKFILEIAGASAKTPTANISGYYHAVNPSKTEWTELAVAIKQFYGDRIKRLVSLEEWVTALEKSAANNDDLEKNPSIKLLDTHKGMLKAQKVGRETTPFDTKRAQKNSELIRNMGKVQPSMMQHWCGQWKL